MARVGLSYNRKFLRLARALGNKALARGVLEVMWEPCFECGDPYLGTSDDLEAVCEWRGERGALTKALLDAGAPKGAGFIEPYEGDVRDRSEPHYQVHDFFHHCPEYARTRRERELETTLPKTCEIDGKAYYSRDPRSRYCSQRCRQIAWRANVTERDSHALSHSVTASQHDLTHDVAPVATACDTVVYTPDRDKSQGKHPDRDTARQCVTQCDSTPTPTPTPTPVVRTKESLETHSRSKPAVPDEPGGDVEEDIPVIAVVVPDDPLLLTFPTIGPDGAHWYLNQSHVDEWSDLYRGHDVLAECRKALGWIRADPKRRKTKGGMPKFLTAWLNRATERSGRGPTVITGSLKTAGNHEAIQRFVERGGTK